MKQPYTYIIVLFFSISFLLPGAAQVPPKKQKKIPERTDTTKTITKKGTMTIRKTKISVMNEIGYNLILPRKEFQLNKRQRRSLLNPFTIQLL